MEQLEARRLLSLPQLDGRFGDGGILDLAQLAGDFFFVHPTPQGKILAIGTAVLSPDNRPVVARLNSDGTPDLTFDEDGQLMLPAGEARDAAIAPDGKII